MISAASVLECSIVIRSLKVVTSDAAEQWLEEQLQLMRLDVRPVDAAQARLAREAHVRYGKGTGHPAGLNFGDCFSYALAKSLDVPLPYKGGDFGRTDIRSAAA